MSTGLWVGDRRTWRVLRRAQRRRGRDDAQIFVLEAILVSALLLGVASYLALAPRPGQATEEIGAQSADLAHDVLQVLAGRPASDTTYESALHEYVTNAILGDPSDLTDFMNRTLPEGADWGIYLDNGEDLDALYETGTPTGEVMSENIVFYPDWNYALVFATMDRQPGAAVTTGSVCTPPPIVVCTPTTTAGAVGTMKIKVVPVKHTYIDRTATGSVLFDNGKSFPLTAGADYILTTGAIVPESPTNANGFDVPYDLSSSSAYASSITAYAPSSPKVYGVNTTLPYQTRSATVYRVHPTYAVDATLQTFLDAQPRATAKESSYKPGEKASVDYDFAGIPLATGWSVQSREVVVYGPVLGNQLKTETLPGLSGTWDWDLPRNLLYGTYTIEVRINLISSGGIAQTVHDVTAFDVLRKGVDEPVPPVYRAVVAVWFNAL